MFGVLNYFEFLIITEEKHQNMRKETERAAKLLPTSCHLSAISAKNTFQDHTVAFLENIASLRSFLLNERDLILYGMQLDAQVPYSIFRLT